MSTAYVDPTDRIPKRQMLALGFVLFAESMCMSVVMPFIAFLVTEFGEWDRSTAGYVSGCIVGIFQLANVFCAPLWGSRSDRFGRRPILMVGVWVSAICAIGFGLSTNLVWALVFRFLWGAMNANVTVCKTATLECLNGKTEAKGYAILSVTWSVGSATGPMMGGLLYEPCRDGGAIRPLTQYLHVSPHHPICAYPALLPCLFVACAAVLAFFTTYFFLEETHKDPEPFTMSALVDSFVRPAKSFFGFATPKAEANSDAGDAAGAAVAVPGPGDEQNQKRKKDPSVNTLRDCLKHPILKVILPNYACIAAAHTAFAECMPLFAIAPRSVGGLGLDAKHVAMLFGFNGCVGIVVNWIFPALRKRYGRVLLWRYSIIVWLSCMLMFPSLHWLRPPPDPSTGREHGVSMLVVVIAAFVFLAPRSAAVNNCFGLNLIMLGGTAPEGSKGRVIAYGQSTAAVARMVSPVVFAPLFAWSISRSGSSAPALAVDSSTSLGENLGESGSLHPFPFNHFFVFLLMGGGLSYAYFNSFKLTEEQFEKKTPRVQEGEGVPLPVEHLQSEDERIFDHLVAEDPAK